MLFSNIPCAKPNIIDPMGLPGEIEKFNLMFSSMLGLSLIKFT